MMTKSDIISAALDELIERFPQTPEAYEYIRDFDLTKYKGGDETIIWRTIINSSNEIIADPTTQQRTIVIIYDPQEGSLKVKIFNQACLTNSILYGLSADATVESKKLFKGLRRNYRKFRKLRKLIQEEQEHSEAKKFLKKLSTSFPSLLDRHIFGK